MIDSLQGGPLLSFTVSTGRIDDQRRELENRINTIGALQRNFENMSKIVGDDKSEVFVHHPSPYSRQAYQAKQRLEEVSKELAQSRTELAAKIKEIDNLQRQLAATEGQLGEVPTDREAFDTRAGVRSSEETLSSSGGT